MALSLTAEQKDLLKIFKIEEQYIIPSYQRAYSWGYEQCFQLYTDIMNNFKPKDELGEVLLSVDYFLGNIIIAKSDEKQDYLEIIDGQQRITSLLLLLKVLSILKPELNVLSEILNKKDWSGKITGFRLKSDIFETNDNENLEKVLTYSKEHIEHRYKQCLDKKLNINENKCDDKFEINILYFYHWLKDYKDIDSFIEYLLKKVYLLPIELSGRTQEEAKNKALTIFETINNRGMNLEDADIFKSKLYEKAEKVGEKEIFIESWSKLKDGCERLKLQIDDIFRYYTHIIRGQNGVTTSEINLRKFFTDMSYSPFKHKKYNEILNDLFDILSVLEYIDNLKNTKTEITKWLQLIDIYTNQYPKIATIAYLFNNKNELYDFNDNYFNHKLLNFLQSLVRYCYQKGSTTTIKFDIYSMVKTIFFNKEISNYYQDIDDSYFDYLGGLKNGYALLAYYLNPHSEVLTYYSIDKIVTLKDKKYFLDIGWTHQQINDANNSLGNFVVLDIPKRNISYLQKSNYYSKSILKDIQQFFLHDFTYDIYISRDRDLKQKVAEFIRGEL